MAGHRLTRGLAGGAVCMMCGGFAEHDLPTECPNRPLMAVEMVNIADGKLNCINGQMLWQPGLTDADMSQVTYH